MAEGKTPQEALRALERQIGDAIFADPDNPALIRAWL